jgi:hypothetical protein
MRQPALWYNGASDRTVPTEFNAELLRGVHHPNWDIEILPGVDHGLFENPTGLEKDERPVGSYRCLAPHQRRHAAVGR